MVAVVMCLAAARLAAQQFDSGIAGGSPAPAVTIDDLDGKPVDLGAVFGKKPVLLEFWATWCPICKSLLPELANVRRTFGDQVDLFGVNATGNAPKARTRRYLPEHHPPF